MSRQRRASIFRTTGDLLRPSIGTWTGRLDLWTGNRNAPRLRFLQNQSKNENDWIAFRLRGNGSTTNSDGIGARVNASIPRWECQNAHQIVASWRRIPFAIQQMDSPSVLRRVTTSSESKSIGRAGSVRSFFPVEANRRYDLVQGSEHPKLATIATQSAKLTPSMQQSGASGSAARIRLTTARANDRRGLSRLYIQHATDDKVGRPRSFNADHSLGELVSDLHGGIGNTLTARGRAPFSRNRRCSVVR